MEQKGKGLSVAGLIMGILGVIFAFIPIINTIGIILGILGVIFGAIGAAKSAKKAMAIVALVLSVAAIAISIGMKAATAKAIVDTVDESVSELDDSMDDLSGKNTDKLLKNNVDVAFGTFQVTNDGYFDSYKLPLTVTNKGKEKASFSIQIEAVDGAGKRIEDDSLYVNDLGAGQSQDFEAFTLITSKTAEQLKSATFKIVEISKF